MTTNFRISPEQVRQKRLDHPKMRERDLAAILDISEAELVAAHSGFGVTRIEPRIAEFLSGIKAVGTVMALTRNNGAVHEKIGVYEKSHASESSAIVLGKDIDLRIFPSHWVHGFAVEKEVDGETRHSLQFFDKAGDAVHKVHLRAESNLDAYLDLVEKLKSGDQSPYISVAPIAQKAEALSEAEQIVPELRERWASMQDVHQFVGILRSLKLSRQQALHLVGEEYATKLDHSAVQGLVDSAVASNLSIMCFVGSRGCIQIHTGPVQNTKILGPWLNVMDPTFHLHLRLDTLAEVWAVRKPVKEGYVTSVEAYDANGHLVIQFFGERHEGEQELQGWRSLVAALPRPQHATAA
jgi:putative hemin transport protein